MALFPLTEHAIEQPAHSAQSDMPLVQRSERTAGELDRPGVGHAPGLQRRRGLRQEILNVVERQAPVLKPRGPARRYRENSLRYVPKNRDRFVAPGQFAQLQVCLLYRVVGQTISLLARSANPEEYDLFVQNALRRRQAKDCLVPKVRCQHPPAVIDAIEGNDHHQYPAQLQPPEAVLQEDGFHPLVPALSHLKIVGRVQIEEGERFDWSVAVEGAALDDFVGTPSGLSRAVRIEFDGVPPDGFARRNRRERRPRPGAWIDRRC